MSNKELPKVLMKLLDSLNSECQLSSWNIHSKENFTQVSIRFSMAAIAEDTEIKFKRVKPSRMKRDRERAHQRSKSDSGFPLHSYSDTAIGGFDNNNTMKQTTIEQYERSVLDPMSAVFELMHSIRSIGDEKCSLSP